MKTLISIVGPTAVGKTSLSVFLARVFDTEILSCDSRQFYKELRIGTAMPSAAELDTAPHHFVGHLSVHQLYTAGDFEKDALQKLRELFSRFDMVVMVGGSGLYERAVTEGLDDFPEVSSAIREGWVSLLKEKGLTFLQETLRHRDLSYYQSVDLHNPHRLIRALTVIETTGRPFSSFRKKSLAPRNFRLVRIGLTLPRDQIYRGIDRRVDEMMERGLLQEAEQWYSYKNLNALQTIGYRELFQYIEREFTLSEAVGEIKKNTRCYAKHQLTWYRRDASLTWFSVEDREGILDFVRKVLDVETGGHR
ncbi:MAG: tRNA (adenosine(37)-N6)-dimethylallyltransferase MiaA [Flavobacteriales bacterium Tduv]